jgi:hypothetical protein
MKKFCVVFVVLAFCVLACENIVTDLPETNTSQFISVGNLVTFPKGTKAIDIYNTVVSLYQDTEYHDIVNGDRKYVKTTTDSDGLVHQTWGTVTFSRIKHTYSTSKSEINTHTVYLWTDDNNIKEIVFEWQRQTTNVWKNESIEGDITFTF